MKAPRALRVRLKKWVALLSPQRAETKYDAEVVFWGQVLREYIDWYEGRKACLYGTPSPSERQKVRARSLKDSAILTWGEMHQKPKYLHDLMLPENAFAGERLLDIGAGPIPSALAFCDCELYCLDPLYHRYLAAGYPLHHYARVRFVHAFSEDVPVDDGFFDAAISVNAIDHVDSLTKTASEVRRVLKPGGKLAIHVHYHPPTVTEPLEINDRIFKEAFGWCPDLKKVMESQAKLGSVAAEGESYALWRNF